MEHSVWRVFGCCRSSHRDLYMPEVCKRHGEPVLASMVVFGGYYVGVLGAFEIYVGSKAGDKFIIVHEGELGQYYADTVEVLSKTERISETYLRLINGGRRIVRPPDYIMKLED